MSTLILSTLISTVIGIAFHLLWIKMRGFKGYLKLYVDKNVYLKILIWVHLLTTITCGIITIYNI